MPSMKGSICPLQPQGDQPIILGRLSHSLLLKTIHSRTPNLLRNEVRSADMSRGGAREQVQSRQLAEFWRHRHKVGEIP